MFVILPVSDLEKRLSAALSRTSDPYLNQKKLSLPLQIYAYKNHEVFLSSSYDVILNRSSGIDHIYILAFYINLLKYILTAWVHTYFTKGTRKFKTYS